MFAFVDYELLLDYFVWVFVVALIYLDVFAEFV